MSRAPGTSLIPGNRIRVIYGQRQIQRRNSLDWVCGEPVPRGVCGYTTSRFDLCPHAIESIQAMPTRLRIVWLRRWRRMSQMDLAYLVGRTYSWMEKVERGARHQSIDRVSILVKLAEALRVDPALLLLPPPSTPPAGAIEALPSQHIRSTLTAGRTR